MSNCMEYKYCGSAFKRGGISAAPVPDAEQGKDCDQRADSGAGFCDVK